MKSTIYHTGYLAKDRDPEFTSLESTEKALELDKLAKRVLKESQKGNAILTQRKLGINNYEYMFTTII